MFALIFEGGGKLIPILSGWGEGKQCFPPILSVRTTCTAEQPRYITTVCWTVHEGIQKKAYMEHISAY